MLVGEPVAANPARRGLWRTIPEIELDHVRKFEILEIEVEHFLARKHETKIVLRFLGRRAGCRCPASIRLGNLVARDEILVARQDVVSAAAILRRAETRFVGASCGNGDHMVGIHVRDPAGSYLVPDGLLQFLAGPPDKTVAVAEALVLRVQPAVDKDRHG